MSKTLLQNFKFFSDDWQIPITVTLNMTWINSSIIAVKIFFEFHIFKFGRARSARPTKKRAWFSRSALPRADARFLKNLGARARRARASRRARARARAIPSLQITSFYN